ncbi:Sae3p TDEL_0E02590 [Torulaspora delbrueckii]|uniref:Swi5-domain-containing protein n=1 Tax=Torulaspora delbrueckii TaxID=4950 RepID=G8ZV58_TORDE|nr:hypothetical protein TDEL_0E02590 [Torulaspora delbrueckii]CCE92502.1 hypothetical protein TDEL_0E02590 [Torulaspora delbrueckii]
MLTITDQKVSRTKNEVAELKYRHQQLQEEFNKLSAELNSTLTPKQVMDQHIKRLKEYNELRDAGLRLTQLISDEKSCKVKDVFEEMGYSMSDD